LTASGPRRPCNANDVSVNPLVPEIEELAFRAWPAAEVLDLDGWRLRCTAAPTRRANSVWPNAAHGELSLDERLDRVEEFYRLREVAPSFQMSEAAVPQGLEERLVERGYGLDAPVVVETVPLDQFRIAGQPPQLGTRVLPAPSDEWLYVAVERGRFAGARTAYEGILHRIGARGGFAVAHYKGKPVAIGLGVVEGDWLGIFNMATLPEARRRRAGTAVLGALVAWASARGATRAYLQVDRDNAPARALYKAAGFAPAYDYHYRTK
jgi:N-acetylglutamate synthase